MERLNEKTKEERIHDADAYAVTQYEEELRGDRDIINPFKKKKKKKNTWYWYLSLLKSK